VFAPSIVYSPGDPFLTLLNRLALLLPVMPISGSGQALYQPIWADDVADSVMAVLDGADHAASARYELAGPDTLSYDAIVRLAMRSYGRRRWVVHVPLPLVRRFLLAAKLVAGNAVFATWDEVELMEVPMTSPQGTADAERLGVAPKPMRAVLGVG
jgi:NADH dehydrogenase